MLVERDSGPHPAPRRLPPSSCPPPNPPACPTAAVPGSKLPPVLFDRTQKVVQRIEQALGCSFSPTGTRTTARSARTTSWHLRRPAPARPPETCRPLHQVRRRLRSGVADDREPPAPVHAAPGRPRPARMPVRRHHARAGRRRDSDGPLAHLSAVDTSLAHQLSPLDRDNDRVSSARTS